MTSATNGQNRQSEVSEPEACYAGAPCIADEMSWVTEQEFSRTFTAGAAREYWLRKAAALDRTALEETRTLTPGTAAPAVRTAETAARRLVELDAADHRVSPRGADLSTGADHRAYVREAYRAWSLTQHA